MTKFYVVTDHHSLCYLMKVKKPYGRLTYWALMLQDFDFEVVYKCGRNHRDADALSRYPIGFETLNQPDDSEEKHDIDDRDMCAVATTTTLKDMKEVDDARRFRRDGNSERTLILSEEPVLPRSVKQLQREDGKWKRYVMFHTDPASCSELSDNFKKKAREYELDEDGVLCRRVLNISGKTLLPVIPYPAREAILKSAHDDPTAGHFGIERTGKRIYDRYFWPKMRRNVRDYVESCDKCLECNVVRRAPAGLLIPLRPTTKPFARIGLDKFGPAHMTHRGYRYVYVVTDYCTKSVATFLAKDGDSIASLRVLEHVINMFGPPEEIVTDNGTEFQNRVVWGLLQRHRIRMKATAALHPQANGQTERMNDCRRC